MEPYTMFAAVFTGVVLLGGIIMYNVLVMKRHTVAFCRSCIDVQLRKRWDLVPQLVEVVKGYAAHEKSLLERVIELRHTAMAGRDVGQRQAAENALGGETPRLMALAEDYPELKADEQFRWLQRNLTEVESQIAAARRAYNAAVEDHNNSIHMFPSSIAAAIFGFKREDFYSTDVGSRVVPEVGAIMQPEAGK